LKSLGTDAVRCGVPAPTSYGTSPILTNDCGHSESRVTMPPCWYTTTEQLEQDVVICEIECFAKINKIKF